MPKLSRLLLVFLIVAVGAAAIWYVSREEPVSVRVAEVETGMVNATAANTRVGTVEACWRARLSPSVGGQISRLPFREGDEVAEGELLLELWNEDLQANVRLAESELNSARSRAEAACLKADIARREADRMVRLGKSGSVSEEEVDQAVTNARAARADCQASRSSIQVSEAQLVLARARLDQTRLYAPFDGVVAELTAEINEYATPSPPGIQTQPVINLIGADCFYVTAPIDEVDVPAIERGMPARITLDAFPERVFEGHVRRIKDYVLDIEKQARTVDVEVEFIENTAPKRLLAGYSADAEIILESREDVLRIPTEALMTDDRVLVFDPDTRTLKERAIQAGLSNWQFTEIQDGLSAGERVVLNHRQENVSAGVPARIETE